jgi:catechol 2,3-dioxygenase-like lactoylglutathione lyase family enzyme
MSRVQLALNVDDIDEAVAFYSKLFDTEPAKRRPGYANFAIAEPPLKLVLLENAGQGGSLNHLGVEVGSRRRHRRDLGSSLWGGRRLRRQPLLPRRERWESRRTRP